MLTAREIAFVLAFAAWPERGPRAAAGAAGYGRNLRSAVARLFARQRVRDALETTFEAAGKQLPPLPPSPAEWQRRAQEIAAGAAQVRAARITPSKIARAAHARQGKYAKRAAAGLCVPPEFWVGE